MPKQFRWIGSSSLGWSAPAKNSCFGLYESVSHTKSKPMAAPRQPHVFISSTCHDLIDLRPELAQFLTTEGFRVSLSDDPFSAFAVDAAVDSIESCLTNVEAADVVVCIIDRRYGGVLASGKYTGKSATHAEIEHAREIGKPIYFFLRDKASNEFGYLRDNGPESKTRWVEPDDNEKRVRWVTFVKMISMLPYHDSWSNWYDPFVNVTDLKSIVCKRLRDKFPLSGIGQAGKPDRLVRITFVWKGVRHPATIYGHFHNVGVGPAIDIEYGWSEIELSEVHDQRLVGALRG